MSLKQIPTPNVDPSGALPDIAASMLEKAAKGDLEAQRRIRQAWANGFMADGPHGPNADLTAASGLFVARMCAANGDNSDACMLATLLLSAGARYHDEGRPRLGFNLMAEAIALFERLSTAGDHEATDMVDKLVSMVPPGVVAQAQRYAKPRKGAGCASPEAQA